MRTNLDTNYFSVLVRVKNNFELLSKVSLELVAACGAFYRPLFWDPTELELKVAEVWSVVDGRFFVVESRKMGEIDQEKREKSLALCRGFIHI